MQVQEIGIRPGEKLHEQLISKDEANDTYEYEDFIKFFHLYIIGTKGLKE